MDDAWSSVHVDEDFCACQTNHKDVKLTYPKAPFRINFYRELDSREAVISILF
jgi:hypothetical protein